MTDWSLVVSIISLVTSILMAIGGVAAAALVRNLVREMLDTALKTHREDIEKVMERERAQTSATFALKTEVTEIKGVVIALNDSSKRQEEASKRQEDKIDRVLNAVMRRSFGGSSGDGP